MAHRAAGLLRRTHHNRYAEGVINKVKVIKRRAYGLPTEAAPAKSPVESVDVV
jgi:hypothetical protein